MRKRYFYLFIFTAAAAVLLIFANNILKHNSKQKVFTAEKINMDADLNKKTKNAVYQLCKDNGAFLFYIQKSNVVYLILDGTHVNLNGEAPCFSDVKVETKDDAVMIYYSEVLGSYPFGKYPQQKLVYKITIDKEYSYMRIFKNGEESHFDGIGG